MFCLILKLVDNQQDTFQKLFHFFVCRKANPGSQYKSESWIERIVILGISNSPKGILLTADGKHLV